MNTQTHAAIQMRADVEVVVTVQSRWHMTATLSAWKGGGGLAPLGGDLGVKPKCGAFGIAGPSAPPPLGC
jgi:hypothetical protein